MGTGINNLALLVLKYTSVCLLVFALLSCGAKTKPNTQVYDAKTQLLETAYNVLYSFRAGEIPPGEAAFMKLHLKKARALIYQAQLLPPNSPEFQHDIGKALDILTKIQQHKNKVSVDSKEEVTWEF